MIHFDVQSTRRHGLVRWYFPKWRPAKAKTLVATLPSLPECPLRARRNGCGDGE